MQFSRRSIWHSAVALGISAAILAGCGDNDGTVKPTPPKPYTPPDNFVSIRPDTFVMGSDYQAHTVILTTPFYMAETEVTNAQYAQMANWAYEHGYCTANGTGIQDALDGSTATLMYFTGTNAVSFAVDTFVVAAGREQHPVRNLSWYGAAAFCDWLSLKEGRPQAYDHATWLCNGDDPYGAKGFRLPTEAEWEFACRAGTTTVFNTGDCLSSVTEANYNGTQPYSGCTAGPYVGDIVAVATYHPNGWDLYDMHGNLWEWCNDWHADYTGDATDPVGPADGTDRIVRGGGWSYSASLCTSATRSWNPPSNTIWLLGFRPVISSR